MIPPIFLRGRNFCKILRQPGILRVWRLSGVDRHLPASVESEYRHGQGPGGSSRGRLHAVDIVEPVG
jgi:hypothetical protein